MQGSNCLSEQGSLYQYPIYGHTKSTELYQVKKSQEEQRGRSATSKYKYEYDGGFMYIETEKLYASWVHTQAKKWI